MSGVVASFKNLTTDMAGWFGLKGPYTKLARHVGLDGLGGHGGPPTAGTPPTPPTLDTAANAANQQDDLMRRRRGILANIYAGGSTPAPTVASKQLLGS